MILVKGRKFVNCFFKKEVFHSSSDLPKNLPTEAQKDQQEQNVDKPQTKLEKSTNPNFNQQLGKLSTGIDSKCTSKFFTFFYSAPQQNLAWCKVKKFNFQSWSLRKMYNYWTLILSWPSLKRCQRPDLPRGWRTSYSWQMRPRSQLPAWSVVIVLHFWQIPNNQSSIGHFCVSSAYMFTWQDLDTKHKRMRTHYPKQDQAQLNQIINSSLIFMVVRWESHLMS